MTTTTAHSGTPAQMLQTEPHSSAEYLLQFIQHIIIVPARTFLGGGIGEGGIPYQEVTYLHSLQTRNLQHHTITTKSTAMSFKDSGQQNRRW